MADSIQLVTWTLEWQCELRPEVVYPTRGEKINLLDKARAYSRGLRDNRVFGDIYVSSTTFGTRPGGRKAGPAPRYPASGFIISEEFGSLGGPEALFRMCGACPANTFPHNLAECSGSIYQCPDSPETEQQIRSIISRFGFESQFHQAFPTTTPIWYGLWAISPVPKASLGLLRTIISSIFEENRRAMEAAGRVEEKHLCDFAKFVRAIEIAERNNIPLQVRLLPLGHADFDSYTIFPHCPRCKASAHVQRWQRKYPVALETCHVCGTEFSPAETATCKRLRWESSDLRELIGDERFRRFACEYLISGGETPEAAEAIVAETEAENLAFEAKRRKQAELSDRKQRYEEKHLYAGLVTVSPPPPDVDYDGEEPEESASWWFDLKNFEEVLRRVIALGIKVTYMIHHSADGERDRSQFERVRDPLGILETWRSDGCAEKFTAGFLVPDSLVRENDTETSC